MDHGTSLADSRVDPCADCTVRDQSLCGSLTDAELLSVNRIGRRRTVARNETIAWAGDDNMICANLLSGVLKLVATTAEGREQIVGLLFPADFVGRPFAEAVDFTITALTDAELCVFPRLGFEQALADHVRMERLLLQRVLAGLSDARGRMVSLARASAEARVTGLLADMAERSAGLGCRAMPGSPFTFDLPLSRGEIAAVLGLTIETVSRQFGALKTAGLIGLPGGRAVTIRDPAALRAMGGAT